MVTRRYWLARIEDAFRSRSVLWLSGVRRSGKTTLSRSVPGCEYLDCELPRVRRLVEEDPQAFFEGTEARTVVLDEIHRLADPSEVLKIAADHFPATRVLATGSSTLGASARFRDTLTGRKRELWLTPMVGADLIDFGDTDRLHRMLHGGLPPMFLSPELPEADIQEWLDAYWARDVQELFRLERRTSFLRLAELLMVQSGGIFEASRFAAPCEVSRSTITNYLGVLEATFLVHVIRPYSGRKAREIVAAPRVYAFDTGFVCAMRGWREIRGDDRGPLWEHLVLNEIIARTQSRRIHYWRDKRGHEVDFVLTPRGAPPIAVECKWSAAEFDAAGVRSFRALHPGGENFVVATDVVRPVTRTFSNVRVRFVALEGLIEAISGGGRKRRSSEGSEE